MLGVEKEPAGDLRNSLYRQQTRSSRRLTRTRLALYRLLVPVAVFMGRTIWRWCTRIRVVGTEHIAAALERAPSFIPVYWHQHQLLCVKPLLEMRSAGVKLGFLISPSVDGEIGAMLVRKVGAEVIRGSSSHTGARALRDYYQALAHEGISPAITPDGKTLYVSTILNTVVPISTATNKPEKPIKVGQGPTVYAFSRDGRTAYVINSDAGTVTPISTVTQTAGRPIKVGSGPESMVMTPNGETLYVVNQFSNNVTPIDVATGTARPPIKVGRNPSGIAITPNGETVYVVNASFTGTVTPIDVATNTAGAPITVGLGAAFIAITPNGKVAYVTDNGANAVTPIDVATNTAEPRIKVAAGPLAIVIVP